MSNIMHTTATIRGKEFQKVIVNGKPESAIAGLKPLSEVRLSEKDSSYVSNLLGKAKEFMRSSNTVHLAGKLGLSREYFMNKIIDVAQIYVEQTPHDDYIFGMAHMCRMTDSELAKFLLNTARKIKWSKWDANPVPDIDLKVFHILEIVEKIARERLSGEERADVLSDSKNVRRIGWESTGRHESQYIFFAGEWIRKNED